MHRNAEPLSKASQAELEAIVDEVFLELEHRWTRELTGNSTEEQVSRDLRQDIDRRIARVRRAMDARNPRGILGAELVGLCKMAVYVEAVDALTLQSRISLPSGETA